MKEISKFDFLVCSVNEPWVNCEIVLLDKFEKSAEPKK